MSSNSNSSSSSGGIGFTGLLTVVFIVLKLCNVINWSWWWVLSPIWISAILVVLILGIYFLWLISFGSHLSSTKKGKDRIKW